MGESLNRPAPPVETLDSPTVTQTVLYHLAQIPGAVHRDTLAEAAGTTPDYAGRILGQLVQRGRVARVGRGLYKLSVNVREDER